MKRFFKILLRLIDVADVIETTGDFSVVFFRFSNAQCREICFGRFIKSSDFFIHHSCQKQGVDLSFSICILPAEVESQLRKLQRSGRIGIQNLIRTVIEHINFPFVYRLRVVVLFILCL
ncbi:hypothetical protein SDC9_48806 [bioreactor metagenome]|uniref:Uncharacterized protein n=1 Tax=bioreactor metagenome TaxID=1076179 RepID=A0A644WG63_9ZZZZ